VPLSLDVEAINRETDRQVGDIGSQPGTGPGIGGSTSGAGVGSTGSGGTGRGDVGAGGGSGISPDAALDPDSVGIPPEMPIPGVSGSMRGTESVMDADVRVRDSELLHSPGLSDSSSLSEIVSS
jgi:hypothetical protein